MIDDEQDMTEADATLKEAIAAYLRFHHEDDTIMLTGVVLQASGSGVVSSEVLTFFANGTKTEKLGLRDVLDYNVEQHCFFGEED